MSAACIGTCTHRHPLPCMYGVELRGHDVAAIQCRYVNMDLHSVSLLKAGQRCSVFETVYQLACLGACLQASEC